MRITLVETERHSINRMYDHQGQSIATRGSGRGNSHHHSDLSWSGMWS